MVGGEHDEGVAFVVGEVEGDPRGGVVVEFGGFALAGEVEEFVGEGEGFGGEGGGGWGGGGGGGGGMLLLWWS